MRTSLPPQKLFSIIFLLLLVLVCLSAQAQEPEQKAELYLIITTDGNEYVGEILEENEEFILLKTKRLGEITISKADVKSIRPLDASKQVAGEFWLDNPQATRYLFAPNGYGLRKGEGYYQNVWIFINQASVGLSDNFSLGAGLVPLFMFAGTSTPVWIIPKFSIPVVENKFNLGAGALVGSVLGEEGAGFGFVYGLGTLGSRDKNVSLGMGWGYAGGDWGSTPLLNLSGMLRVGRNTYLLSENYFISSDNETLGLLTFGARSIIRRIGLDYAAMIPASTDAGFFILPWLGLTVPFGSPK